MLKICLFFGNLILGMLINVMLMKEKICIRKYQYIYVMQFNNQL